MLESLYNGKEAIQAVFIEDYLNVEEDAGKTVLDNDIFWAQVQSIITLLKHIEGSIAKIESENAVFSEVPEVFSTIDQLITDDNLTLARSAVLKSEEESLV